jgi:hypothetical protein
VTGKMKEAVLASSRLPREGCHERRVLELFWAGEDRRWDDLTEEQHDRYTQHDRLLEEEQEMRASSELP